MLVRPRPSYCPFASVATLRPLVGGGVVCALVGGGGGASSIGESGGGGMFVPSVRLKFIGASAGSSKRPFDLPLAGIFKSWVIPADEMAWCIILGP